MFDRSLSAYSHFFKKRYFNLCRYQLELYACLHEKPQLLASHCKVFMLHNSRRRPSAAHAEQEKQMWRMKTRNCALIGNKSCLQSKRKLLRLLSKCSQSSIFELQQPKSRNCNLTTTKIQAQKTRFNQFYCLSVSRRLNDTLDCALGGITSGARSIIQASRVLSAAAAAASWCNSSLFAA